MGGTATGPLSSDEISGLATLLLGGPGDPLLLLAVSGGADSMALMHICAELVREHGKGRIVVATVDHGLRDGSADDARFVVDEAERIGLAHVSLAWEGEKPTTGLQAAAREARYRLLANVYHREFWPHVKWLITAHTLDDQAETFLMRLARGSGVDGLSAMSPIMSFDIPPEPETQVKLPPGLVRQFVPMSVLRPFLPFPKTRLIATLQARGLPWREDPSNDNTDFERVRVRRALSMLLDLGVTPAAIAQSARRLGSAREALTQATQRALCDRSLVRVEPFGYAELSKDIWTDSRNGLSEAITLRVLAALIRIVGGHERPLSLQALETVARQLSAGWHQAVPFATTIGRTKITRRENGVQIVREAGRDPPPPIVLAPGQQMIWDNRFHVSLGSWASQGLELRFLGPAGYKILKDQDHCPSKVPSEAIQTLPSLWAGDRLVSVPGLAEAWTKFAAVESEKYAATVSGPGTATFQDRRDLRAISEAVD
ncbi:MAG: tRNA lysidine(34) synthetase TilS [Hyphomicrobium sp.]